MKIAITLVLLILLGGVGAGYIAYQHNVEANDDIRNTILDAANGLKQRDSMTNTFILESRYGLRSDYDDLATSVNDLRATVKLFSSGRLAEYAKANQDIKQLLITFNTQLALKIELVESFKSHNSILRNSIQYAPELGEKLIREAKSNARDDAANQLALVNDALYRWALNNDNKEADIIQQNAASIIELYSSIISGVDLIRYSNHVTTVVEEQEKTQGFINKILAIDTQSTIAQLESKYLDHYVSVIQSSEENLYYVFIYALMVLMIAIYLGVMLKKSYSVLSVRDNYRSQQLSVARKHLNYADTHAGILKETLGHIKDTLKYVDGIYMEAKKKDCDNKKVRSLLTVTLQKYRSLEKAKVLDKTDDVIHQSSQNLERVSDLVDDLSMSS